MHTLLATMVLFALTTLVGASEQVDTELSRYHDVAVKAQKAYEEGMVREQTRLVPGVAAVARAGIRSGDMATGVAAWKLVLRLDRDNQEARSFFTALGQLDQALAETQQGPDPLTAAPASGEASGAPAAPKPATVKAVEKLAVFTLPDTDKVVLGPVKAGSVLLIQYVEGQISVANRVGTRQRVNPDEAKRESTFARMVAVTLREGDGDGTVLAHLPPNTAATPFEFRVTKDIPRMFLSIGAIRVAKIHEGVLRYRVTLQPASP